MARVEFTGNVGREPELRFTQAGTPFLKFSVCESRSRKRDDGSWETLKEQWVECSLFDQSAQFYAEQVVKGARVTVFGDLWLQSWKSDEGVERQGLSCTVKGLHVFPPKEQQAPNGFTTPQPGSTQPPQQQSGGWGQQPQQPQSQQSSTFQDW